MDPYEDNECEFLDNDIFSTGELFDDNENKNGISGSLEIDADVDFERGINEENKEISVLKSNTKRIVRNPRVLLNFERLKSSNGLPALSKSIKRFKFNGKHHEKEDLTEVMKCIQHWMCHSLYPGYDAETCMRELERLGRKRVVQTYMRKMRREGLEGFNADRHFSEDELHIVSLNEKEFDSLLVN